jgi:diphosphomevalonate decarboxylase
VKRFLAVANTMQALVKYHGLRDWRLRIPYHDSISVNTTSLETRGTIDDSPRGAGGVFIRGVRSENAEARVATVLRGLIGPRAKAARFRIDSSNHPELDAKGLGFSSSAGAALTLLCHAAFVGGGHDDDALSRAARLFAASASRSLVGGFSRLYAGRSDEDTFARRFADAHTMDLRMVIVPLPSRVRTEDAHKEVETSPFFKARIASAQKRSDEMEEAILRNDLEKLGVLAERDTMELHALTMTGENRLMVMSEDSIRVIRKVKELRGEGVEAYFSLQTGPSVFVNTSERHQKRVRDAMKKLGYASLYSGVGPAARVEPLMAG